MTSSSTSAALSLPLVGMLILVAAPVMADTQGLAVDGTVSDHGEVGSSTVERLLTAHGLRGAPYRAFRDALVADASLPGEELAALSRHEDWRVRETASAVLGWRTSPQLFQAIQDATPVQARSGRQDLRHEAFSQPNSRPAVVERLLHGSDSSAVRSGVAVNLVGKGEDWAPLTVHILAEERSAEVRVALLWMLRAAEAQAAMDGAQLGLMDTDATVRAQACRTVGYHPLGAELVSELLKALDDDDGRVRADAARALGWLRAEEASDALVPGLVDPVPEVRLHSLRAISRLDPSGYRLVPWLGTLMDDQDSRVARLARRLHDQ